jgi:hypothetical protein
MRSNSTYADDTTCSSATPAEKGTALYLRRVVHPQAQDNYRVVLKLDEGEFEIGSIGIMHGAGLGN